MTLIVSNNPDKKRDAFLGNVANTIIARRYYMKHDKYGRLVPDFKHCFFYIEAEEKNSGSVTLDQLSYVICDMLVNIKFTRSELDNLAEILDRLGFSFRKDATAVCSFLELLDDYLDGVSHGEDTTVEWKTALQYFVSSVLVDDPNKKTLRGDYNLNMTGDIEYINRALNVEYEYQKRVREDKKKERGMETSTSASKDM